MRARRAAATAALLGASLYAGQARAQFVDWRASFGVTGAYTQTVTAAPFPTLDTYSGPSIAFTPSLNGIYETPRTQNTLTYAFSVSLPFTRKLVLDRSMLTYSNRFAYAGRYQLDEITSMMLGAGVTQTPLNSFTTTTDPTEAPISTVPAGALSMLQVSVQEGITRELGDAWALNQLAQVNYGDPIDPTTIRARTLSVQTSLGVTRSFFTDTVGLIATNEVDQFSASEDTRGALTPAAVDVLDTLAITWARPLHPSLVMTLNAGITQILLPGAQTKVMWQPTGSAGLSYTHAYGVAGLLYQHQVMPNLATAQINVTDTAALRLSLPIGETTGLSTQGSGGYSRMAPIGDGVITPPTNLFIADVALDYKPPFVPILSAALRGQLQRQAPTVDALSAFTRYSISLTMTVSYPSATAGDVRPRLSPVYSVAPPVPIESSSSDASFGATFGAPATPSPASSAPASRPAVGP